jgi:dihydrofolate reductase
MAQVVLSFSMSLDGFVAGPDISMENAMGVGGDRLHEWMFPPAPDAVRPEDGAMIDKLMKSVGAVVLGRRTYDLGLQHWNDTPFPAPSFVLTHRPEPEQQMKSASFQFVTQGIEAAVTAAKAAAGDKAVIVMGAETGQEVLRAGLADALHIQVVSVLLGDGTRLFDQIGDHHIELRRTRAVAASPDVTHLEFDVVH